MSNNVKLAFLSVTLPSIVGKKEKAQAGVPICENGGGAKIIATEIGSAKIRVMRQEFAHLIWRGGQGKIFTFWYRRPQTTNTVWLLRPPGALKRCPAVAHAGKVLGT